MLPNQPEGPRRFRVLFLQATGPVFLAGTAVALLILTIFRWNRGLDFDDSYIFARYAQNIVDYGNYGWNAYEHTYGCTNIPFTYFIVLLKLAGADHAFGIVATLLFCSLFWAWLSLALLYKIVTDLTRVRLAKAPWLPGIFIASLALAPVFSYNAITGMDSTFSLFFSVLMIFAVFRFQERPSGLRLVLAAAAAYFAFLCRPDCGIYTLLFPVLFFRYKKLPGKQIIAFCMVLLAFIVTDTIVKYLYFGDPLPLPFYVKQNHFYLGYLGQPAWNVIEYLFDFLFDFGFLFLIFLITGGPLQWKRFFPFGFPLLLTLGYYFTVMQIMGYHARYYLPSMPFFVIGCVYAMCEMPEIRISIKRLRLGAAWVILLLLLQFSTPVYREYLIARSRQEAAPFAVPAMAGERPFCTAVGYGSVLREMKELIGLLPDRATVAATEYGYLSVEAPTIKFLDLCGLNNREIARNGYNENLLRRWQPVMIWLPHVDYTQLRKQILTGTWFREHYDYFPGAMIYGVAILKSSDQYELLKHALMAKGCR